jgi:hypothetical protein
MPLRGGTESDSYLPAPRSSITAGGVFTVRGVLNLGRARLGEVPFGCGVRW